jgi:hypothetical protein
MQGAASICKEPRVYARSREYMQGAASICKEPRLYTICLICEAVCRDVKGLSRFRTNCDGMRHIAKTCDGSEDLRHTSKI